MVNKITLSNNVTFWRQEDVSYKYSGAYSDKELYQYFENLNEILQKTPSHFAFAFKQGAKAMDLFYDASLKKWQLIDHRKITKTFQDTDELVQDIKKQFTASQDSYTILTSSVHGIENKDTYSIFTQSKSTQKWKEIQEVTPQKAQTKNENGFSWIHAAARVGEAQVVDSLLKMGANPNQANQYQRTPLHYAAFSGSSDTVKNLLARDANPNAISQPGDETPLSVAWRNNKENIIDILLPVTHHVLECPKVIVGQDWLLGRLTALGYPVGSSEGICYAIARLARQAALLGEIEKFEERLKLLYLTPLQILRDFKAGRISLTTDKQKDIDMLAFFDGIEIYQNIYLHKNGLLEKHIRDAAISLKEEMIVAPAKLEKDNKVQLAYFSGTYTLEELEIYLIKLEEMVLSANRPFSLILGQSNHDTELSYDRKQGTWCFVHANDLPVQRTKNIKELARMIKIGLTFTEEETCLIPMITTIDTTESNKQEMMQCVKKWENDEAIKKMHEVTFEKAKFILELDRDDYDSWIMLASQCGEKEKVKRLAAYGADVNLIGVEGYLAADFASDPDIRHFLRYGQNLPHLIASAEGFTDILRAWIDKGIDIKQSDESGRSALHYAVKNGHTDTVKFLIESGADLEQTDHADQTALSLACAASHIDIIKLLIENGAGFTYLDKTHQTILHWAADNGHIDIVKLLIEKGIDLKIKNPDGKTAFDLACAKKHTAIVNLINHLNIEDEVSKSTVIFPCFSGAYTNNALQIYFETVYNAIKFCNGIFLNLKSFNQSLNLYYDSFSKKWHLIENKKIIQEFPTTDDLIKKINHIFSKPPSKESIFITQIFKKEGDKYASNILINWKCHPLFRDELHQITPQNACAINDGFSWLHAAASMGEANTVKLLLENNANIELKDLKGRTPLVLAFTKKHFDIVEILVDKNADLTQTDRHGLTVLHYAITNRNIELVEFLLSKGANPNQKSKKQTEEQWSEVTPLRFAVLSDELALVKATLVQAVTLDTLKDAIKIAEQMKDNSEYTEMADIIALLTLRRREVELKLLEETVRDPYYGFGFHQSVPTEKTKAAGDALKEVSFGSLDVKSLTS